MAPSLALHYPLVYRLSDFPRPSAVCTVVSLREVDWWHLLLTSCLLHCPLASISAVKAIFLTPPRPAPRRLYAAVSAERRCFGTSSWGFSVYTKETGIFIYIPVR